MKSKLPFLFISGLILINLLSNSCKKDKQNNIEALFSSGSWQLASVRYTISVGDTIKLDTVLNTKCDTTQVFTFKEDKSCTYTNFDCIHQPTAKGNWALSENNLFLSSDIVCKDTTKVGSSKPFANAQIYNIGQYSLVLLTGDIQNYTINTKRKVIRYGFVRQKAAAQ
ncbi:MAG: lipocalin family protein [Bacteroidota bacterium]